MLFAMYQAKPKKNALLQSTLHTNAAIAESKKKALETVKCYNETKCEVNVVVQMTSKYSARAMT